MKPLINGQTQYRLTITEQGLPCITADAFQAQTNITGREGGSGHLGSAAPAFTGLP